VVVITEEDSFGQALLTHDVEIVAIFFQAFEAFIAGAAHPGLDDPLDPCRGVGIDALVPPGHRLLITCTVGNVPAGMGTQESHPVGLTQILEFHRIHPVKLTITVPCCLHKGVSHLPHLLQCPRHILAYGITQGIQLQPDVLFGYRLLTRNKHGHHPH